MKDRIDDFKALEEKEESDDNDYYYPRKKSKHM